MRCLAANAILGQTCSRSPTGRGGRRQEEGAGDAARRERCSHRNRDHSVVAFDALQVVAIMTEAVSRGVLVLLGCLGSLAVSAILTWILLAVFHVL